MKERPHFEREITLEDLARRYPDTARDLVGDVYEIPGQQPPSAGRMKRLLRDLTIGLLASILAGIALIWLIHYFPQVSPI
jgi:hypothetical protein